MPDLQPLDAVARVLDLELAEAEELAVAGVLPEAKRGKFDVLLCVRAYAKHMRDKLAAQHIDWAEARRLFELEGVSFSAIAPRVGASRNAVGARAKREGWVDRTETVREAGKAALREFVRRDTNAVLENLALKHGLNRDLLQLARRHVDRLARDEKPNIIAIRALRDLAIAVRTIESVDAQLANLREETWGRDTRAPVASDQLPDGSSFSDLIKARKRERVDA